VNEYLQQLNDSQREAVLYDAGPSLVVAGAGSGKTRVLTYKIAHLLKNGYQPHSILALTFTNKAAREMKERIASITDEYATRYLWMGTFHSIFYKILRREASHIGYASDFTIYDATDSKNLIKAIIKEMKLDDKIYRPSMIQSRISNAKNSLITSDDYHDKKELRDNDAKFNVPYLWNIYETYQKRCRQAGVMDFDELLLQTNILFRDHKKVLERYQTQFRYVLVDEYQDTNFAQHLIVKRLCEKHQKIFVVGDDAQSIYSFRGANIDNMLRFEENYPSCRIFKLERNYRSTQTIVDAANSLIDKNAGRIRKNVYSENEKGSKLEVLSAYSDYEEAYIVTSRIIDLKREKGYTSSDFAILYRTNAQSRILEETFRKRMLSYRVYGSQSFYQRKEIKDVIAYLRVIVNPRDEESIKRIINYPARGIGGTTLERIMKSVTEHDVSVWKVISSPEKYNTDLKNAQLQKLRVFKKLIDNLIENNKQMNAAEITELAVKTAGIYAALLDDNTIEGTSRLENVQELLKATREFVALRLQEGSEAVSLTDFLTEVSLMTDQDDVKDEKADKVTLMTVHSAKGLEFKNVIIVGMENQLFPSAQSLNNPRALEEERRLFYVAITRAKENCIITYSQNRFRNGQNSPASPSFFINDIDSKYLSLADEIALPSGRIVGGSFDRSSGGAYSNNSYSSARSGGMDKHYSKLPNWDAIPAEKPIKTLTAGGFTVGEKVLHDKFGVGVIEEFEGTGSNASAYVAFTNSGRRKLLLKYAKLVKI
jgi:DNA helicase-2/ATP-dependent DNA helicase PcrA